VRGINISSGDQVVSMLAFPPDVSKTGCTLLTVTELGFAKRSDFDEYRVQSRGGKGIINLKITERNGNVVGVLSVMPEDEFMTVTKNGMIVRCPPGDIRQTGRSTQGVKLISLKDNDKVTSIANVVSREDE
jgi:DNA gyrase subunit A